MGYADEMLALSTKACSKCGKDKPYSSFHRDKTKPDGYTYQCKKCRCDKKREWMQRPATKKIRAKQMVAFRATPKGKSYTKKLNDKYFNVKRFGGLRDVVLENYGYQCVECGTDKKLCIHHKDGKGRNCTSPNNSLENLVVMCLSCHMRLHRKTEKGDKRGKTS